MLAKAFSFGLWGIEAYLVEIEVDITRGLPAISVVGQPDSSLKESKERVKSALKNSGFEYPAERITINLAPSQIRKEGTSFDLAIALGLLAATEQLDREKLGKFIVLGELALDGNLRPVRGVLPVALAAANVYKNNFIVPYENAKEAALIQDIRVYPARTIRECVQVISDKDMYQPLKIDTDSLFEKVNTYSMDFSDVRGQILAKRALEVAVSGGHNVLMIGPPGGGKTMLSKRIPTIMPKMNLVEALGVTKVHSISGILPTQDGIVTQRPFRAPHHTISNAALVGGSSNPQPGEISLAHQGVLFLDELPEFHRDALEALRQPLEDGVVRVSRSSKSVSFPASFMLVCAMNPCPCGYYTDPNKSCRCSPNQIQRYIGKISGPLLDRIDIHIDIPQVKYKELTQDMEVESSEDIRKRIEAARSIQGKRFASSGIFYNAAMTHKLTKRYCTLNAESRDLLRMAINELGFSARAYNKILKVSRTIADLAGSEMILAEHISEAIQYRSLDRQYWE